MGEHSINANARSGVGMIANLTAISVPVELGDWRAKSNSENPKETLEQHTEFLDSGRN
jgi:hypothetical protein